MEIKAEERFWLATDADIDLIISGGYDAAKEKRICAMAGMLKGAADRMAVSIKGSGKGVGQ